MFSAEERCIYRNNPLGEVICQFRFPEILTIETNIPDQFQETIRDEFPVYAVKKELAVPKITGLPGNLQVEKQQPTNNYQFTSADGVWRINLTSKFISLTCSRYTCWEDFARKLDKPLAAFLRIYRPAYYERVGLRYLNFISRRDTGIGYVPYRELIAPKYLGILADEQVSEVDITRNNVDAEFAIRGGCRVKIHAGPGLLKRSGMSDQEVKFIFDQDLYMPGRVDIKMSAAALQTLHSQAFTIFRDAITDTLHNAMEPIDI